MRRKTRFGLCLLCAALLALQGMGTAQQSDGLHRQTESEIRTLIGSYFDFYSKKDLEGIVALWSPNSPVINARRELWQRMFPRENYEFSQPVISRVRIEGARAFARVAIERTSINSETNVIRKTGMRAEYSFILEEGKWKFWSESSAIMGLYGELIAATTDAERERLLDEDPLLVTRELMAQLSSQSDYAYTAGDYDRAFRLLSAARIVARRLDDKKEEANSWLNLGIIHFMKRRYPQAIEAYQRALALNDATDRKSERARALTSLGLVYTATGKFREALDYFNRGLVIQEELKERAEISRTLDNIGELYYEQGEYNRASEYFQKSLAGLDSSSAAAAAINRLIKIARTEYEQGKDGEAVRFYERALGRMDESGVAQSAGFVFHNIANIYYSQGDYAQALHNYLKGQAAQQRAGNPTGELAAWQGIALIHSINGNYGLALEGYQKNLSLAETLDDKNERAAAHSKIGGSLYSLSRLPEAVEAFQKALALRKELGDSQDIAFSHLDLGSTFFAQNDHAQALEQFSQSRALYQSVNNSAGVAAVLLNESLVYYARQNYARTLELATQAVALAKAANETDLQWQALHRLGKAHLRLAELEAARKAFEEAITIIETFRPQNNRANQPRFFENRIAPYLAMVDVMIALKQGNEAFNYAERAKARSLLGVLQSGKVWINKTMSPAERETESRLMSEQAMLNAQVARESEKKTPNRTRLQELLAGREKANKAYAAFLERLYRLRPGLKVMRGIAPPLDISQAVLLARDPDVALLDYIETEERIYLFAFTKNTLTAKAGKAAPKTPLRIYLLDLNRTALLTRLAALNQAIASRTESVDSQSRDLFNLLLEPALPQIAGKRHLILMPDGGMWGLPFSVLQTPAGQYLIEEFALSQIPSMTAYSAIRQSANRSAGARRRLSSASEILFAGAPVLAPKAIDRIRTMLGGREFVPPASEVETTDAICRLYGEGKCRRLFGPAASEEQLKAEAVKFRIGHFHLPGFFNESAPLFSALALGGGGAEDGMLELREVMGLEWRADLVVLPSNEFLIPQAGAARSLTALCWSFYVAGCPLTLIGQWTNEPATATGLMIEFHKSLQTGAATDIAWQQAVKKMLARDDCRHPFFWAGYSLLGRAK